MDRRALLRGIVAGGAALAALRTSVQPLTALLRTSVQPLTALLRPARAAAVPPEAGAPPARLPEAPAGASAPWHLVAPLTSGSPLGGGWAVESLSGVAFGAAVLSLVHRSGERAHVHLCRRPVEPRGLACTAELDLFLMNGAEGDRPTDEGIGRAVKTVALCIAQDERLCARGVPDGLMTHAARVRAFGPKEILG